MRIAVLYMQNDLRSGAIAKNLTEQSIYLKSAPTEKATEKEVTE